MALLVFVLLVIAAVLSGISVFAGPGGEGTAVAWHSRVNLMALAWTVGFVAFAVVYLPR
jgi:hypothetical protein